MKKEVFYLIFSLLFAIQLLQAQPSIEFGTERGFFESSFSLELSSDDAAAIIKYTVDGSDPYDTLGITYTAPIPITTNTIIRAFAYNVTDSSVVNTNSYFFLDDVVTDTIWNSWIIQDPVWGPQLKSALLDLPTISIVSDQALSKIKAKGSMELIFPDTSLHIQANCGISYYGNASVNFDKKNIRMYFDDEFGPNNLEFPIYEGFEAGIKPAKKFDKLDLRSSHDTWLWKNVNYPWHESPTYISTKLLDDIMLNSGNLSPHNRHVHVYFNGTYWGQFDLRERFDDNFLEEYMGGDIEDYEYISGSKVTVSTFHPKAGILKDGTGDDWNALVNSSNDYLTWKTMVEENSYFDLIVLFMYGFQEAEWKAAGSLVNNAEFAFQINDADLFFSRGHPEWTNKTSPVHNSNGPNDMFLNLFEEGHPDFLQDFADRASKLLQNNGFLTPASLNDRIDALTAPLEKSIIAEAARWGDAPIENPEQWINKIDSFKTIMVGVRTPIVLEQMKKMGVFPDLDPVQYNVPAGLVTENTQVTITNPNPGGTTYYTTDGSDPRLSGGAISPVANLYSSALPIGSGVTQINARIKGQQTTYPETNIGINKPISASNFANVRIPELANDGVIYGMYADTTAAYILEKTGLEPWLEIDLESVQQIDLIRAWSRSEFAVSLFFENPYIFVSDVPFTSEISADLISDPNVQTFQFVGIGADVFEVPLNTQGRYVRLQVETKTRFFCSEFEILQVDTNNPIVKDIWSPMLPQTYYTAQDYSGVVINELHYHQQTDGCGGDSLEVEFIEIMNAGTHPVDISGCSFAKGIQYTIPYPTILNPGAYLVFAEDAEDFYSLHGFQSSGQYDGNLSNDGELIQFEDPFGVPIDVVEYNDKNPWDEAVDGGGRTLELLHPSFDNSDPYNWFRSDAICGTPRAENSRICNQAAAPIVINEINYNSNNAVFDPGDWIELHNTSTTSADLSGWTVYDDNNEFIFPQGVVIPAGGFLLLVEDIVQFKNEFPYVNTTILGDLPFSLSNKGERISLFDAGKCLADVVLYDNNLPWDTIPNGVGPTLSLIAPNLDNNLAASWESSGLINADYGTPGRENEPCPIYPYTYPDTICLGALHLFQVPFQEGVQNEWVFPGGTPSTFSGDSVHVYFSFTFPFEIKLTSYYYECESIQTGIIQIVQCNQAPTTNNDSYTTEENTVLTGLVSNNDNDLEGDQLTYHVVSNTTSGNLILNTDGAFIYFPNTEYVGMDSFVYEACDDGDPSLCSQATVTIEVLEVCIDIQLAAWFEGVYQSATGSMPTTLNTARQVLPGMLNNPVDNGQPYDIAPWNYSGTEGQYWIDSDYPTTAVDWVLISLRQTPAPESVVYKAAGLIHEDGTITLVNNCSPSELIGNSYYVVVEHRNHLSIMSPSPVAIVNRTMTWDFRPQDSYHSGGAGQIELSPGVWVMLAGDGDQTQDPFSYDINGQDRTRFFYENGNFTTYLPSDYNMDGDVNGADKSLWSRNNGVFSAVAK